MKGPVLSGKYWVLLFVAWAAAPWICIAADSLQVDIVAPKKLQSLLLGQLELVRASRKPATTPAFFRRLYKSAPEQIRTLLAIEGYFRPKITATIAKSETTLQARFEIEPMGRAHVSRVDLRFVGAITQPTDSKPPTLAYMTSQWTLPVGAVFKQDNWESAKSKLLRAMSSQRYPTAKFVKTEAHVDAKTDSVAITVVADSGPVVTFGDLEITGLQRYDASVIRNLNNIKPGEDYSLARLQELQEKVQNTLYFSYVAVTSEPHRGKPGQVPIRVAVTEAMSSRLGLGLGLNTDTGIRGQIEYNNLNFWDRGWRLNTTLRTEAARQLTSATLDFPVTASGHRYGLNAGLIRTTVQELDTNTLSVGGRRTLIKDDVEKSIGIEYLWEHVSVSGTFQGQNAALYPSIVWNKRRFDNLLDPMHGYAMTFELGGGLRSVLSKQDFLRVHGKVIRYFSPWYKDQIILRGELGAVFAPTQSGIPNLLLYRTGGDQSVRGYAYQRLGLRVGKAVLGARYVGVASAEYVHWLSQRWGAAMFCDVGDAVDRPEEFHANLGFGLGARWRSPVGPVYLDVAYGESSRQLRLHFALGIRF